MAEPPNADPRTPFRPAPPADKAQPAAGEAGDPSMEDILASIRRILSEDEAAAKVPELVGTAKPIEPVHDVLLLDEDMMVADPPPTQPVPPEPPALSPVLPVALPPAVPTASMSAPVPAAALGPEPLVAPAAALAAASSLGALVRTIAQERSVAVHRGGPTIEDLVREEIRPILKDWLDANLPPLVERLVRAEIERVVGQASS